MSVVVRGVDYDVPEPLRRDMIDFDLRPHRSWSVLRSGVRAERKRIQAELDAWCDRVQSDAALPRAATSTGFENWKTRRSRHDDPTVDVALARLNDFMHEGTLRVFSLWVDERAIIQVAIRPFRSRHVRRIKEICGPAPVEVRRSASGIRHAPPAEGTERKRGDLAR